MMIRSASLSSLALVFAAACGGNEPEAKTPEGATPTTPTDSAPSTTGSGHEGGHAMTGPGEGATGAAGATGQTGATGATGTTGAATDPAAAPLSDEQILNVVHVANLGEIDQAKIAQQKAKNAKVKAFAAMMIKDHTDSDAKGNELAKKSKLTLTESPVSTTLKADSDKAVEQLKTATGADLDRAYMDAQVKAHQTVLDTIDTKLLPNAKSADLKAMLQATRPKIEAHLKEAQDIQKTLVTPAPK